MKKNEIFSVLQLYLAPVLVIVLGVLLLVSPDSASVLISRLLGGLMTLVAVFVGISALFRERRRLGRLILAVFLFACGGILSARPLLLASFAGRVVGLLLLLDGLGDMVNAHHRGVRGLLPLIVTILGAVLVLMPMTASRLVFSLCGLVVAIVGVFMLVDRICSRRLPGGDDPNIIDAL